jgi:hypothetical protein
MSEENKVMSNNELAKFWEDKLRLSNWDIKYIFDCHRKDFVVGGRTGECATNYMLHSAIIKIADETELFDDEREGFDFEQVLVHELLHLNFDLLYGNRAKRDECFDGNLSDEITHYVINTVACALVKTRRQE